MKPQILTVLIPSLRTCHLHLSIRPRSRVVIIHCDLNFNARPGYIMYTTIGEYIHVHVQLGPRCVLDRI